MSIEPLKSMDMFQRILVSIITAGLLAATTFAWKTDTELARLRSAIDNLPTVFAQASLEAQLREQKVQALVLKARESSSVLDTRVTILETNDREQWPRHRAAGEGRRLLQNELEELCRRVSLFHNNSQMDCGVTLPTPESY